MLALIDMDLVCFRCAASAENDDLDIAKIRCDNLLDTILREVNATEYRAFLSSGSNFRKTIYPEYKANRTADKPKHLDHLRTYAITQLNAEKAVESLEADDMMSIYQDKSGQSTIICSLDKDMLQVPGQHYQWEIGTSKWVRPASFINQTELEGLRLFYEQCLKGDVSDNVKGIAKIGPVKAQKALEQCKTEQEMFDTVRTMYNNDDEFLMNASCLWILRTLDDDYSKRFERLLNGIN
jgi:DNA polymerase-1